MSEPNQNPLPPDPPGWNILLTEEREWQPKSLADGTALGPYQTKLEAFLAIADHEGKPSMPDGLPQFARVTEEPGDDDG